MSASDRYKARTEALRAVEDVCGRLSAAEAEVSALLAERAQRAREAREAGVPVKDLQDALGVTRARVYRIAGRE